MPPFNFYNTNNEVQKIMAYRPNDYKWPSIVSDDVTLVAEKKDYNINKAILLVPERNVMVFRPDRNKWPIVLDDITQVYEKEEFITKPLALPPEGYLCHHCKKSGHYIQDCPSALHKDYCKTHYQGQKQCKGEFKCDKCKRKWSSVTSWANIAQMCNKCKVFVYPHKQMPITRDELLRVANTNHAHNLCQKCIESKMDCRTINSTNPKGWFTDEKENCGRKRFYKRNKITYNEYFSATSSAKEELYSFANTKREIEIKLQSKSYSIMDSKQWSLNVREKDTWINPNFPRFFGKNKNAYSGYISTFQELQTMTFINGF